MPTSGTHVTIIQRLSLRPDFKDILGWTDAEPDTPEAIRMKFATLGAIGPDLFYALMDYDPQLQNATDFLSRVAGSFESIAILMRDVRTEVRKVEDGLTLGASTEFQRALDIFTSTFDHVTTTIHEGLMAAAVESGKNFFPIFEARRQLDEPREKWFWADYLHYVDTGAFVRELLVSSAGDPNFRAYAYGYLTHYITDVVGHPFVNQVTEAPWRLYWQRHHLVENHIDAYVWDRWHDAHGQDMDPITGERPPDRIRSVENARIGDGAPFTSASLHDLIDIGIDRARDPVDKLIDDIGKRIRDGVERIDTTVSLPAPPDDADLDRWATKLAEVFKVVYPPSRQPPTNLKGGGRTDGYPTASDIKSAYSLLRLFLRVSTEATITEPEFPNVVADVRNAIDKMVDRILKDLAPPAPTPSSMGKPSFENIWAAFKKYVNWAVKTAIGLAKAAIDLIRGAIKIGGTVLIDTIRAGLYVFDKALFDIYKNFRLFLVRSAYAIPFTEDLDDDLGHGITARSLWCTQPEGGEPSYPIEEVPDLERERFVSRYAPWIPPHRLAEMSPEVLSEMPLTWVAPYALNAEPNAFIDGVRGPADMLSPTGPVPLDTTLQRGTPFVPPPSFGSAMENCIEAFHRVGVAEAAGEIPTDMFPNYNLDGDRGYGWLCWDVRNPPDGHGNGDKLTPAKGSYVTVDPVLI